MATTHYLKCDAAMFDAIAREDKTFEIRRDDRAFQAGDELQLTRLPMPGEPPLPWASGPTLGCTVTFVLRGGQYGIEVGFVGLSIRLGASQ